VASLVLAAASVVDPAYWCVPAINSAESVRRVQREVHRGNVSRDIRGPRFHDSRRSCPRQSGSRDPLPQCAHCEMPTSWAALLHALLRRRSGEDHAARKSGSSKPFVQTCVRRCERVVASGEQELQDDG